MIYYKEDIRNNNKIDILPMIDIIFAILSFLIISSLYLSRVDTIPIDLPKATSSLRQDSKFINIFIDKSGGIFLNRKKILLDDIRVLTASLINESMNLVVLHADINTTHGEVINVLDLLRSIDGLKIAISTKSID
tara:strand:+ start:1224 stop:1628 length:405 start_codon:yes stop_codon:yes gene_type:complete